LGGASQASQFNADIANSVTVCRGQSFTAVESVQCYGAAERTVILQDLPALLHAYDFYYSVSLSAASNYESQMKLVPEKAAAAMKSQMGASEKRFNLAVTGIPPPTQTDKALLKQVAAKADSQCMP
jgi:hypothetical protein